ncbi:hypothetical protein Hanom_Chr01g00076821 [Helianthus anomalus]
MKLHVQQHIASNFFKVLKILFGKHFSKPFASSLAYLLAVPIRGDYNGYCRLESEGSLGVAALLPGKTFVRLGGLCAFSGKD